MRRMSLVIVALFLCLLQQLFAEDATLKRGKDETIATAERLFGQRYTPVAGKPLRLYDKQTETGPPDAVIYWHGSSYVIELIFAGDGTVAKLVLQPEALLHSDTWSDVPNTVELAPAEMQWLVASANVLRPLGNARIKEMPNFYSQSGPNLYCVDHYELATVTYYQVERLDEKQLREVSLREITILYKQSVGGIVQDVRVQGSQREVKVDGQWYRGEKPDVEIFDYAQIGSVVRLITYGCTANETACIAVPEQSKSAAATEQ